MNFLFWPFKWARMLAYGAVSGALVYALATQWAGDYAAVELVSHFRMYVLGGCLAGSLLFLVGLSLARAGIGLGVAIWLAWPMIPYYVAPEASAKAAAATPPPEAPAAPAPAPEIKLALFNVLYRNNKAGLMDRILAWDADVVMLLEANTSFYRSHFQRVRELYPVQNIAPQDDPFGLWCFTRLPVAKDLCKTRSKAFGSPACDWTLRLANGSPFRLIVAHPAPPLDRETMARRQATMEAAAEVLAKEQGPRILAGDLNCTPFSRHFDRLLAAGRLHDTALGLGLSATWMPVPALGLPVDHILVSDHWQVVRREIGPDLGSDHRPVLLTLRKVR